MISKKKSRRYHGSLDGVTRHRFIYRPCNDYEMHSERNKQQRTKRKAHTHTHTTKVDIALDAQIR